MATKKFCDYCGKEIERSDVFIKDDSGFVLHLSIVKWEKNATGERNIGPDFCRDCAIEILQGKRSIDPAESKE
jgi:hypothetical protein